VGRNIYFKLLYDSSASDSFTLVGGASSNVDVDLYGLNNCQFIVEVTYASTSATTGTDLSIFYGIGNSDSTATGQVPCKLGGSSIPKFGDNSDAITLTSFTTSSASSQTKYTYFSLNDLKKVVPRWLRLKFANNDATKSVVIRVYGDA
jgi:hypothetical protein